MEFHIITLFPHFFDSPLQTGVLGRALEDGIAKVFFYPLVNYKESPKHRLDDIPYGGGAGMLMRAEPLARAVDDAKSVAGTDCPVIHFTPRGKRFSQTVAERIHNKHAKVILLCGRYEGIDERLLESYVDMHLCVGDAILSGGEYPALFFVDAVTRLLPGVLGNEDSPEEESFSRELGRKKEYPHYTRPEEWRGLKVPEVLISGHHKNIKNWRQSKLS